MIKKIRLTIIGWMFWLLIVPTEVWAYPNYYISGPRSIWPGHTWTFSVYLDTDEETITAAQSVVTFNDSLMDYSSYSTSDTRCSFWAPIDPSVGYGNESAPYLYGDDEIVFSCGFSNPGYLSDDATGDLIAKFSVTPKDNLSTNYSTQFTFSNEMYRYIGNTVTAGTSDAFSLTVYDSTQSASYLSPTPTPVHVPGTTLTDSDLEFIEIGTILTSGTTGTTLPALTLTGLGQADQIAAVDLDDTIPPPPDDLEARAPATPYPTPRPASETAEGEVMSIQSLRELLIPGKTSADKTVVLVNLLSTLMFLIILTILIWRLVMTTRLNKLKYRHMKDVLKGEMSVIESKMLGGKNKQVDEKIEELKKELDL